MKKIWFCEQSERCVFIICETVSSYGWYRTVACKAIYRDEWKLYAPAAQTALFEQYVRDIDYDILQVGAL